MKNIGRSVSIIAVATLSAGLLASCGMMRGSNAPARSAQAAAPSNVVTFRANLSGSAEVPPNSSPGKGEATVQLNRDTNQLNWMVTHSGMTGPLTGAHIHGPAQPGANAGVVVPFNHNQNPITGSTTVTPQIAAQIMAGQTYVNLHTAQAPGGEIRGQLTAAR